MPLLFVAGAFAEIAEKEAADGTVRRTPTHSNDQTSGAMPYGRGVTRGGGTHAHTSRMSAPRALTPPAATITLPATTVPTNMPAPVSAPSERRYPLGPCESSVDKKEG